MSFAVIIPAPRRAARRMVMWWLSAHYGAWTDLSDLDHDEVEALNDLVDEGAVETADGRMYRRTTRGRGHS